MAASSVTGTGIGSSGKPTTVELAGLVNGPAIYAVGSVLVGEEEGVSPPSSPPAENMATVTLPVPLPGIDSYAIILTGEEGINPYIADMTDNEDGSLTGFTVSGSASGTVYYMVVKKGFRLP